MRIHIDAEGEVFIRYDGEGYFLHKELFPYLKKAVYQWAQKGFADVVDGENTHLKHTEKSEVLHDGRYY